MKAPTAMDSGMATIDDGSDDSGRRVVPFRPRAGNDATGAWLSRRRGNDLDSPVSDLTEFERSPEGDDYRHRMLVNAAALAVTLALVVTGVWIAESMAGLRKNQDCVLMGRRSCAVAVLPTNRRLVEPVTDQQR